MLRIVLCCITGLGLSLAAESPAPWLKTGPGNTAGYSQQVQPGLSAQQYLARARSLANQAQTKHSTSFADKPTWRAAILNAETAAKLNSTDSETIQFLAELYTKTQWWKRAYLAWRTLRIHRRLTDKEREMAALSAGQVGYSYYRQALSYKDRTMADEAMGHAVRYLEESLKFKPDPDVQKVLSQAKAKTITVLSL